MGTVTVRQPDESLGHMVHQGHEVMSKRKDAGKNYFRLAAP